MPIHTLSPAKIERTRKQGRLSDGGGLYLSVSGGSKVWVFRNRHARNGRTKGGQTKSRFIGLGPLHTVSLDEEKARELRQLIHDGRDPIQARAEKRAASALEAARTMTFDDCVTAYVEAHKVEWKSPKTATQWKNSVANYASSVFGKVPVAEIDLPLVLKAIEPIWLTKVETADRVRARIEAVLDWAKAREYRTGENPARWRGHLDHLLPARGKVAKVKHLPSLPYAELSAFMARLRTVDGITARALEFTILCATRTGDICGKAREDREPMLWKHVELDKAVWTIPATKTDEEHKVPLSTQAVAVLRHMETIRQGDIVFPGARADKPLAANAMLELLNEIEPGPTVHGFRASFKTWATEVTHFQTEVVEKSLAHAISNEIEAAYQRGELMAKRRLLMAAWADYCDGKTAEIIQLAA